MQAFHGPRAGDVAQVAARDAVILFQDGAVLFLVEQAQRRFVDGRAFQAIEGHVFHQRLELFRDRRLAAADRAQQVQDLLALFQALRGVAEVGDDLLDDFLGAVELAEGGVDLDHLVGEDARQARVVARVDQLRLADGGQHAFGRAGIRQLVLLAQGQVFGERHFLFAGALVACCIVIKNGHVNVL